MGQSPSATDSRHDNASTRTLHSTSMISNRNSNRRLSFFRRLSNRLSSSTHSTRRYGQIRGPISNGISGSSTTSSVRRATQEATRAAVAVTGPPALPSFIMQTPTQTSGESITSATESFWNELITSPAFGETTNTDNSNLRYLQVPLSQQQQEVYAAAYGRSPIHPLSFSASSRRMHILVIEYSSPENNSNTANTGDSLPGYRFLGLRRPRSEVSTSSSTDTIQSMSLSVDHNQPIIPPPENGGQWMIYTVDNQNSFQALYSALLLEIHLNREDHNEDTPGHVFINGYQDNNPSHEYIPSYEDLLELGTLLGTGRPLTTTQAVIDESIPFTGWSHEFIDESCLVCLDEFELKQPVRVLKCQHIFHRECVDRWLCEAQNSCPVCRGVPIEN